MVHDAPASRRSTQIATSASSRAAHEFGGGDAGLASPRLPATTVTLPPSNSTTGMSLAHNIVKYGSTILSVDGRLSQIWNSSVGFGSTVSTSGNISLCTMPAPAVSHCVSPRPKRAVAPSESQWSISPLRTNVTVSNPR